MIRATIVLSIATTMMTLASAPAGRATADVSAYRHESDRTIMVVSVKT